MNKLEQAARQALEALESHQEYGSPTLLTGVKAVEAITALREALAEQAEQPVSQEYQDHLVNQSFDWAAMAAKHQFMEGYRIGLAEMRERCANICETDLMNEMSVIGAGIRYAKCIRAINFEGDTGFRPVSEMIAEHKQDPKKAAAIEKAKMRKAEQEPVAVISESAIGLVKLHSNGVSLPFDTPLYAAPVRTKDLTDDEIDAFIDRAWDKQMSMPEIIRAVIVADREKNK